MILRHIEGRGQLGAIERYHLASIDHGRTALTT